MSGYCSCMKHVDHSYEQALIMHDNIHIHVIVNIIVTSHRKRCHFGADPSLADLLSWELTEGDHSPSSSLGPGRPSADWA